MQLNLQSGKRRKPLSLTPLIDVVFILLLFFMLTSSFIKWHNMELAVSAPSQSSSRSNDTPPLVFRLNAEGELRVAGQAYTPSQDADLQLLLNDHADASIILQTADEVDVQQIVSTIDRLKRLGADGVSLNTDR
ncbi:Biopolymer transport protein ExbD/TolR [Nitrincola lacisaponensis]|uniref:Biopolymer transport protein ExbD/TolR n=1 Tax=Nitrincola lacisaponensis TaxID=267850 RepID=A0A063Y4E9_9GAMM|nr:biopolymer transporter ExbD [Nitrincola lacisaponensis]KDE39990.1 Biopolymer transport protein ExbD/TolR [Nitrincola lacisaponensis]